MRNPFGVAVDQTTGYVYVLNKSRVHGAVQVFSADGSELIAGFGEHGTGSETFEESPEKLHSTFWSSGIAVDGSGTVYVSDNFNNGSAFGQRVMVWKPQTPGDYEHYVYTGRANDIDGHTGHLAIDDAGNLYSANSEEILEFAPGENGAPICEYDTGDTSLSSMTANPANGEVFFHDADTPKVIHQLGACDEAGEFEEKGKFTLTPLPDTVHGGAIRALAFNPSSAWSASRPAGILYGAEVVSGLGYIFAPAEVHPPEVKSEFVSSVTATTALLGAQINPRGSNTHYAFQYETAAEYEANPPGERFAGASEAPPGGSDLAASQEALGAAASLVGLTPDTEYRYRVIAVSHCNPEDEEEACEDTGEDRAFRTFPLEAPGLPDHRAWELVSPAQKFGGEVFPLEPSGGTGATCFSAGCKPGLNTLKFPRQSSPNGEAVVYEGFPFSASEGAANLNEYISRRTPTGWQTTILAPALMSGGGAYTAFNAALTEGILYQTTPSLTPSAPFEYANLYTQPAADPPSLTALLTEEPPNRASNGLQLRYAGASDDLSHVFFEANDALTGETPFAPEAVDGGSSKYNLYEWVGGQLRLVNVLPGNAETAPGVKFGTSGAPDLPHAISADGSRAFWSDEAEQLYVRIDGELTVAIPDPGKYLTASDDGSQVLLTNGHLYDLETETTTDLTEGEGGFLGIAGHSEDLSHIYFVDTAVLTGEEENDQGAKAQAGKYNLYSWHAGEVSFVATLANVVIEGQGDEGVWSAAPNARTAEASPDGRWLAFQSLLPVTGYDNVGPTCNVTNTSTSHGQYITGFCREAFLYDSATGELRCVSCSPSGARPLGKTRLPVAVSFAPSYLSQPRYLLDSGRLYFDTQDALSPFDTNRALDGLTADGKPSHAGDAGAEDVYQYEPEGVGTCEREGGCVNLISGGHESGDSNFLAVDETGKNVFFTTRDQLTLKDRDDLMDLYVAREGGGILSETETGRGECQGEACQPQVSPPNDPTPGSSAFEGSGNVVEEPRARCAKGKVRRRGRCVKRHPRKHAHRRAAKHDRGGAR